MKSTFIKIFMGFIGLSCLFQSINHVFFNEPLTIGYYADYLAFIYLLVHVE